jgi:hypothetical protein
MLARRRGAAAKRGPREGHASCVCPYVGIEVVSWTWGASKCPHGAMRGASAPWLHGYVCGGQHYAGA